MLCSARPTILDLPVPKGHPLCLSVRHTSDPPLNGSRYVLHHMIEISSDVCTLLIGNFVILGLGV